MYEKAEKNEGWLYDLSSAVQKNILYQQGTVGFLLPSYRYSFNFALTVKRGGTKNMKTLKVSLNCQPTGAEPTGAEPTGAVNCQIYSFFILHNPNIF